MIGARLVATTAGCFVVLGICGTRGLWAQETAPATTQPATAPTERTPITARVLEVRGDVKHAPLDSSDWQPCRADEEYPEQTVILTGVRSSIKLRIGSDDTHTVVVIESASKTIISEAYRTPTTKRVRIGVGYGRIRAGVAEGGLRSDFTVDSPVATLSKRGTWDFGLFYERGTDRFEIFLLDQGLVEAFNKATRTRRELLPGEAVTHTMRRWADEVQFRRNVPIPDLLGQGDVEVAFNNLEQSGLRVLSPEGGQTVLVDLSSAFAQNQFAALARRSLTAALPAAPSPRLRPEGFFGTGRGDELISVIIEKGSPLAERGFARPGTYNFRRSALEGWLERQDRR
jgi:hypothetical protein